MYTSITVWLVLAVIAITDTLLLKQVNNLMANAQSVNGKLSALKTDVARVAALFPLTGGGPLNGATQAEVDAMDAMISGIQADVAAIPTPGSGAFPQTPTAFASSSSDSHITLTWNASPGATSYTVKRGDSANTETFLASIPTTTYVDVAVTSGKQYFYKVSASNAAGTESRDSLEVNATA